MKHGALVTALALAALAFGVLMPPEAYPAGKMAVILCSTFAFLAALAERRIPKSYGTGGIAVFSLLLAHSLLVSVDPYRSLEFVTVLWAYYGLLGFFLYSGVELRRPLAGTMVTLAAIVAGYGLYQYFRGFDQISQLIFYSGSDTVVKVPALDRIATRRVFSTLALPGTLWGFLLIALPFHAALWRRNRLLDAALVTSAAMSLAAGFLTRSFGFLAGSFVLMVCWLLLTRRRALWNRFMPAVLLLAIAAGVFYSVRRGVIEHANPLTLRFANWISAWQIFSEHPLGVGLNTFGIVYSQVMLPGANETQYAHNTMLQLMSELGYPALVAGVLFAVFLARRLSRWRDGAGVTAPVKTDWSFATNPLTPALLGLAVWITHNAIDIDLYFPSLGLVGAALTGIILSGSVPVPPAATGRVTTVLLSVFALAVLAFSSLVLVSSELQYRAQIEYDNSGALVATATLEQAKAFMPFNSSLYHDAGEILLDLSQKKHDPKYLAAATDSFKRAIALSPGKVGPHLGLGLCFSSGGSKDAAIKEARIAESLYPSSAYVRSVRLLLEKR